jgi:hypothetical protein
MAIIENQDETIYHSDSDKIYVVDNKQAELIGVY